MKITRVEAFAVTVPTSIEIIGLKLDLTQGGVVVEVETDDGTVGHGFTAISQPPVIEAAINKVAAPRLVGDDPLLVERIWQKLYWLLTPRGQSGHGAHAIAAIDVALWDIKGKAAGQPVWKLLGGARNQVPTYVTFGLDLYDRDQLAEAAKWWVANGNTRLKMVVGRGPHTARDADKPMREYIVEDARRVRAVRDAVGDEVELFLDANCTLDQHLAVELACKVADCGITFFEEPIAQNDVRLMADMRRRQPIPLACGQNEGLASRFRDMLVADAVDFPQPNAVITGGFTLSAKIAGMAAAFNKPIANGGAWTHFNAHLQAGVANGTWVEWHHTSLEMCRKLYRPFIEQTDGMMTLPDTPGLGFSFDMDAVREYARPS